MYYFVKYKNIFERIKHKYVINKHITITQFNYLNYCQMNREIVTIVIKLNIT